MDSVNLRLPEVKRFRMCKDVSLELAKVYDLGCMNLNFEKRVWGVGFAND